METPIYLMVVRVICLRLLLVCIHIRPIKNGCHPVGDEHVLGSVPKGKWV